MDDAFTIQISADLVKQLLAEDNNKVKKKTRKQKPTTPKTTQPNQVKPINQKEIHDHPATGWPPMYLPIPPPAPPANAELEAIRRTLQDSEKVLEKLQKKENEMAVEVTQKAKELHDKEFKIPQPKPMPCSADLTACLDCYKQNTKDPLKCSILVKRYADCARTIRQQASSENH